MATDLDGEEAREVDFGSTGLDVIGGLRCFACGERCWMAVSQFVGDELPFCCVFGETNALNGLLILCE